MADNYHITMDTSVNKAMFVHIPDKIVRFGQLSNRLYRIDLNSPNFKSNN